MTAPLIGPLQELLGSAYRLERELAGGGMSRVFVARDLALGRDVVVKVLPPELLTRASVTRFRREIAVTAPLQHPHILPVLSAGGDERMLFYLAPYVRGQSLRDVLDGPSRPTFDDALRLARELLSAVSYAHRAGVVHRDIKPGNVLVSEGHAVLADFGIARALSDPDDPVGPTGSGTTGNLGAYRAPERPNDATADLWAIAAVIAEVLSGAVPPPDIAGAALAARIRVAHPTAGARQGRAVADVLAAALSAVPGRRYATADGLRVALDRAGHAHRFPRAGVAGVLLVGALAVGVAGWGLRAGRRAPDGPVPAAPRLGSATAESAWAAERSGDLGAARRLWMTAAQARPNDAATQLRAALLGAWMLSPLDLEGPRVAAGRAFALRDRLDAHDAALATGLARLSEGSYPAACEAFERARAARQDFDAWFGLGECRRRDEAVVRGVPYVFSLSFRGNWQQAADAYGRALALSPRPRPAFAWRRLADVLAIDPGQVRRGTTPEGRIVQARASAVGDSIVYVPRAPGAELQEAQDLRARALALEQHRARLRPLYGAWVRERPDDAEAAEAFADVVERAGAAAHPDGALARGALARARARADDRVDALRLGRAELRLALRAGDFRGAARLAGGLLAGASDPTAAEAELLIGPAMLTGRGAQVEALGVRLAREGAWPLQMPDGRRTAIPPATAEALARFEIRAALGMCDDVVREGPGRLRDALAPVLALEAAEASTALGRAMTLARPCLGATGPGPLAAAGDARSVVGAYGAAAWRAGRGDSAGARAVLEDLLAHLPDLPPAFADDALEAAAVARAVALYASLLAEGRDRASARRWGAARAALLDDADRDVRRRWSER